MRQPLVLSLTLLLFTLFVLVACAGQETAPTPAPTPLSPGATAVEPAGTLNPTATPLLAEIVATRAPAPTATPGPIEREVTRLVTRAGLSRAEFLGISVTTWIDIAVSLFIVLLGYVLGTVLINRVLPPVVRRTPTPLDDQILEANGRDLRWVLVIFSLYLGTQQLRFISPELRTVLADVYFVAGLALALRMTLGLIRVTGEWYSQRSIETGREEELSAVITMLVRVGTIAAWVIALTVLLSHFGVNVSAFAAALGLGGLAISLAARDTVADAIAGMLILVDRPFRVGDRIEIKAVDTWGDVVDIGLRTTRIRTRDNRLVIVPNSSIGANEVINYSYPDPNYRIQTHVGIAYGSDIENVRRVLVEAVRGVEGVLPDKPVDALYIEMNDAAMIFRVRWWIGTYADTRRMEDRVHTAMQRELDEAGIQIWPYIGQNIHLQVERETAERVSQAFWSQRHEPAAPDTNGDDDGG